jgi:hypothetical protein
MNFPFIAFSPTDYKNSENVYFKEFNNFDELNNTLYLKKEQIYNYYYINNIVFIDFFRNIILILKSIPNLNNFLNLKLTYLYKADKNGFTYMFKLVNPNNKDITHLCLSFNDSHTFGDIYFAKNYKYDDKPLVFDEALNSEFNIPFFNYISIEDNDLRSKIISLFEALYGQSFQEQTTLLGKHHMPVDYYTQSNDSDIQLSKMICKS